MKKKKLKKWAKALLITLGIIGFVLGSSDSDNTKVFAITHIIAILLLAFDAFVLSLNID